MIGRAFRREPPVQRLAASAVGSVSALPNWTRRRIISSAA
jgi:hypothetical protein